MSWDEDDYGDDSWGYDGDPVHDEWVDYTTDMYEGTNYSGENPDWEDHAEDFAYDNFEPQPRSDYHRDYSHHSAPDLSASPSQLEIGRLEKKVLYLEGALAASLIALAKWEDKAARASTPKNIAKFQRHIESEKAKIADYRHQLDKAKSRLEPAQIKALNRNTIIIAFICGALVMLGIMLAIFI